MVKKSDAVVKNHVCISFEKLGHIEMFLILVLGRGVPLVKKSDALVENSVYISNVKFGLCVKIDAYMVGRGYHWSKRVMH